MKIKVVINVPDNDCEKCPYKGGKGNCKTDF